MGMVNLLWLKVWVCCVGYIRSLFVIATAPIKDSRKMLHVVLSTKFQGATAGGKEALRKFWAGEGPGQVGRIGRPWRVQVQQQLEEEVREEEVHREDQGESFWKESNLQPWDDSQGEMLWEDEEDSWLEMEGDV